MKVFSKFRRLKEKGLNHILHSTIPYCIMKLFDPILAFVAKAIYLHKPLQNVIIIESHNDFDSHGGAFYEYLLKEGYNRNYKIVWFLRNSAPKKLPKNVYGIRYNRVGFKKWKYHCIAKCIVCGHLMIETLREGQISVYTTHGSFSLKKAKGFITIPKNVTYYLCSSENVGEAFADCYSLKYPNDKELILGFPAHDILTSSEPGDMFRVTSKTYSKVILWMPTFRQTEYGRCDTERNFDIGIPLFKCKDEFFDINNTLKNSNCLLIIKIHPMQNLDVLDIETLSNIIILDGKSVKDKNIDNYRLMRDVDALISDYSSAASDFLQLDRPIAYTIDDLDDYALGFMVEDPKELMGGHLLSDVSDLKLFIKDIIDGKDPYKIKRDRVRKYIFRYSDNENCKRLADFLGI